MASVTFDQATRCFPKMDHPAVDGLELDISDGEFMVLVGGNETMEDLVAQYGTGGLTDSFPAGQLLVVALLGAGFAVQTTLRPRGEEAALRAEPPLVTPVSRVRLVAGRLSVALGGRLSVLAAAGLGTGLAHGATGVGAVQVPLLVTAALAYARAPWPVARLATALFERSPCAAKGRTGGTRYLVSSSACPARSTTCSPGP
ncbi:hypothetical protein O3Q52_38935 [Streptomyces sp. ActVer]|uniref:hypothetical protein n=1 Tax=Streptomyces sp. ActVer TaxID=3014558 RepID=UPI0022B4B01F|nr:hypothetical protein [Streptomyces sp. ActVer]MCZ4514012.1 hypothetical protein [Streptomyces sp. ActVer]